jgi:biotin operon repressor
MSNTKISRNMSHINRENLKVRILKLADLKSTGSPADLANRFGIGERSVKRLVSEMREEGQNIKFSQSGKTYINDNKYY